MKTVVVLATGGTIASVQNAEGDAIAAVSGADLLGAAVLPVDIQVRVEQLFQLNSFNLTPSDMARTLLRVQQVLSDPEVCACVITHGTDTMEETGFFLSLFHDSIKPVILTGSQRSSGDSASDGIGNLQNALIVAVDERTRGLGVLIVFDGEIWSVPETRKSSTLSSAAFDSPHGALGGVLGRQIAIHWRPIRHSLLSAEKLRADSIPRVDIVSCYPGADTTALDAVVKAGASGLVIEGMGAGNPGRDMVRALAPLLAAGMPIVLTSRVATGRAAAIYGDGGGAELVRSGAVLGGLYRAPQLRILVIAALGSCDSPESTHTAVTRFLAHTNTA
ncbi:asparaginase [Subtercola vilae]|uniref:asparaginase n=1 Tax=Subtercola vilae TaxID=2056433 RepID=UPI0013758379|nr:asparaginase [Subtercola vilae]